MNGSSSNGLRRGRSGRNPEVEIGSLRELLDAQDEPMRALFAKALNLYVSPGADATSENERLARLKQAIEESLE